jgi:hypothetical protein
LVVLLDFLHELLDFTQELFDLSKWGIMERLGKWELIAKLLIKEKKNGNKGRKISYLWIYLLGCFFVNLVFVARNFFQK